MNDSSCRLTKFKGNAYVSEIKQDLDLSGNRLNYINAAGKQAPILLQDCFPVTKLSHRRVERLNPSACFTDEVGYIVSQIPNNMVLIKNS
jgi:hypothetical protein